MVTTFVHYNNILHTCSPALNIAYFHYFLLPLRSAMVDNNLKVCRCKILKVLGAPKTNVYINIPFVIDKLYTLYNILIWRSSEEIYSISKQIHLIGHLASSRKCMTIRQVTQIQGGAVHK